MRDMARVKVSLFAESQTVELEWLKQQIGITPDLLSKKGEPLVHRPQMKQKFNRWELIRSYDMVEDPGEIGDRIEAAIKELAIRVSGSETAIAEVAKSVHVGISIAVLSEELPVLDLSSQSVQFIAAVGAAIHFDLVIATE
jgi:hypothetical protein